MLIRGWSLNFCEALEQPFRICSLVVFGVPPLRVDILNRIEGIELKAVIKKANRVAIDDTHIRVVAIEDLIAMKLLAGRPQDKADVAALKRAIRKRQA
jgi:predicted nucleotidyltransferase